MRLSKSENYRGSTAVLNRQMAISAYRPVGPPSGDWDTLWKREINLSLKTSIGLFMVCFLVASSRFSVRVSCGHVTVMNVIWALSRPQ